MMRWPTGFTPTDLSAELSKELGEGLGAGRRGLRAVLRAATGMMDGQFHLPASLLGNLVPGLAPDPSLAPEPSEEPTPGVPPETPGRARPWPPAEGVVEVEEFGSNPGKLRMLTYAPAQGPTSGAPLVLVLHGCTQTAAGFAAETGWMALADRLHFPLLLPEQASENNQGRCFNWFRNGDIRRSKGEALSIRQMVAEALRRFRGDPRQVFVVGLSAGGAMTAALLAAYPDVFAGGAVVAGLPVGCAVGMSEAMTRMRHPGPELSAADWAERARGADATASSWPRLSIWHGSADHTVDPGNSDLLAVQWRALLGLQETPDTTARPAPGTQRRQWTLRGAPVLEQWTIDGMRHAYPIDTKHPADADGGGGHAGSFVAEAGVDATAQIARFWRIG
jgi:poly(hydroxyalkanoate) depolymerase family esterase